MPAAEHILPNNEPNWRQVYKETKQDMSKINNDFKINQSYKSQNIDIDYFIEGLQTEANKVVSENTTKIMHNDFSNFRNWVLQRHIFIAD